jgi:predicted secreted protein
MEHDINIMQMPCPESLSTAGTLTRVPHGKKWYEDHGLRVTARDIAQKQVHYMKQLIEAGNKIIAIVGVEFSPACAVTYLNKGRSIQRGKGIYVEELERALSEQQLTIRIIGISQRWTKKMVRDLRATLSND